MTEEVWKDIEGFQYQVSNLGRVKSLGRYIHYVDGRTGKECQRWSRERVLKSSIGTSGYDTTHIYKDDTERHTVMIHRLVAEYFLEKVDGKDLVNHKDGNKLNNAVDNLEWVTFSENVLHALDTGLLRKRGEDCNFAKLSEKDVVEIVALRKYDPKKFSCKILSAKYQVSEKYVSYLASGQSSRWKHIDFSILNLREIFESIASVWNPESLTKQGRKYKLSDEESESILKRRTSGERVIDIAKDFNLPPKFIGWFTRKHLGV